MGASWNHLPRWNPESEPTSEAVILITDEEAEEEHLGICPRLPCFEVTGVSPGPWVCCLPGTCHLGQVSFLLSKLILEAD